MGASATTCSARPGRAADGRRVRLSPRWRRACAVAIAAATAAAGGDAGAAASFASVRPSGVFARRQLRGSLPAFLPREPKAGEIENHAKASAASDQDSPHVRSWQSSLRAVAGWLAAASAAMVLSLTLVQPAFAESATGFAEFAKKGGAMQANPSCFITDCGKETKECFVEDGRCLKGALCLARCRGDPDCATQCFAEYGCPRLDRWLHCTVETKQCVSVPEGTYDVKKFYETDVPVKLKDFDVKKLDGLWYKVRGYNPKYDCYPCQTNMFRYNSADNTMETEVKLRLERKRTGGYWPNKLTEKMRISGEGERSTLLAKGEIFGLSFQEEWYVLGADDDFVVVAYTGNNLQDAYKGSYVYARTPTLTPEVEEKAKAVAVKNGYTWSKYCIIDNACPAQADTDYSKSITLGWDDVPDLIEWFAPGTTRGGTVKEEGFMGEY